MYGRRFVSVNCCRRGYASAVSSRPTRFGVPRMGLDHFIQRGRALALYRDIVRSLNKIPPSPHREELRQYARTEFERNRGVTDITHIRYLISTGKTEFDTMNRYIEEMTG